MLQVGILIEWQFVVGIRLSFFITEIECDKKKSYSVKKLVWYEIPTLAPSQSTRDQICKVTVRPILQKKPGFILLKLTTHRGAVLQQGEVSKTWFFRWPGAEEAGSSKNQFFPSLLATQCASEWRSGNLNARVNAT